MIVFELTNFYDQRFRQCFRAYFQEIGINLKVDTDVFDLITESYEKENMRTFVIEDQSSFKGFIMLQPEHLKGGFFEEQAGFIRELWVAPDARRAGYGKQLIEIAEKYFSAIGITKLILTYEEASLSFYKKMGFCPDNSYKAKNNQVVIIKSFL